MNKKDKKIDIQGDNKPKKKIRIKMSFQKKVSLTRRPKLSEINELSIFVVIIDREFEREAVDFIKENKGIILSRCKGKGISRAGILSALGAYSKDITCIISMVREEESIDLADSVTDRFDLNTPGNGKAFIINSLGYMGAKAPFVEVN